ncbi:unnamed protein product [Cunninghamella blakesleeana]
MDDFQDTFSIKDSKSVATILSVPMAASCLSAILSGPIADYIGRKRFFYVSTLFHLTGTIIQLFSNQMEILLLGRIVTGISLGIFSVLVPLYQSEIAIPKHRGRLITLYQLGVTVGFCLSFWMGYCTIHLSKHLSWKLPLYIQLGPSLFLLFGIHWCIPESPRWLVYIGKNEEASIILEKLRRRKKKKSSSISSLTSTEKNKNHHHLYLPHQHLPHHQTKRLSSSSFTFIDIPINDHESKDNLEKKTKVVERNEEEEEEKEYHQQLDMEYQVIVQDIEFEKSKVGTSSFLILFSKGTDNNWKRTLLGMGLHIMTQCTGINAILFYLPQIMESTGLTQINSALLGYGISGVVNMVATIPVFFYIDRVDRRRILTIGAISMSIFMIFIAIVQGVYNKETHIINNQRLYPGSIMEVSIFITNSNATLCILVGLCTFIICFSLSWGALGYIYPAEIYPQLLRARAMGVTTGSMFAFSILISQLAPLLFRYLGWRTYVIFACLCALMAFIVHTFYPETKGKTFEEIQLQFSGALIDQSAKAHHPTTAAEAWENIEKLCQYMTLMKKTSSSQNHAIQKSFEKYIPSSPITKNHYDVNKQPSCEVTLDERSQSNESGLSF